MRPVSGSFVVFAVLVGLGVAACNDGPVQQSGGVSKADVEPLQATCPKPAKASLVQRIGPTLVQACEGNKVDPLGRDAKLDASVEGRWAGQYIQPGEVPVRFEARFQARAGELSGSTAEPNTFGPAGYAKLEADVTGDVYASRQVVWLKTYRTSTVDHSVLYVGRLDDSGERIEGAWRVGSVSGTFWMTRE